MDDMYTKQQVLDGLESLADSVHSWGVEMASQIHNVRETVKENSDDGDAFKVAGIMLGGVYPISVGAGELRSELEARAS